MRRALEALRRGVALLRVFRRLAALEAVLMRREPCKDCGLVVDVTHPDVMLTQRDDGDFTVRCRWCYNVVKTIQPGTKRRSSSLVKMG